MRIIFRAAYQTMLSKLLQGIVRVRDQKLQLQKPEALVIKSKHD